MKEKITPDCYWVYFALGMDCLASLIERDNDEAAKECWRQRYGHDFPLYANIDGCLMLFEH